MIAQAYSIHNPAEITGMLNKMQKKKKPHCDTIFNIVKCFKYRIY